jgi:hypothetical protein
MSAMPEPRAVLMRFLESLGTGGGEGAGESQAQVGLVGVWGGPAAHDSYTCGGLE